MFGSPESDILFSGAAIEIGAIPLEAPTGAFTRYFVKVYDGAQWVRRPVRVYSGSAFVGRQVKVFT